MSPVSEELKLIARTVSTVFRGNPRIQRYWDSHDDSYVDVLTCSESPCQGVTSYSTIGLSAFPLYRDGNEFDARLEIVGAMASNVSGFGNVISTAAFCVINSKWFCCPGMIYPDIIALYGLSMTMEHLAFVSPLLWDDQLRTIDVCGKKIAWLLALPISDNERQYADKMGFEALEDVFVKKQIDVFDINRASAI